MSNESFSKIENLNKQIFAWANPINQFLNVWIVRIKKYNEIVDEKNEIITKIIIKISQEGLIMLFIPSDVNIQIYLKYLKYISAFRMSRECFLDFCIATLSI